MAISAPNNQQALQATTLDLCRQYVLNLPKPDAQSRSYDLRAFWRDLNKFVSLFVFQLRNAADHERIALKVKEMYDSKKMNLEDICWLHPKTIRRCTFLDKDAIDKAILEAPHLHKKTALASLALAIAQPQPQQPEPVDIPFCGEPVLPQQGEPNPVESIPFIHKHSKTFVAQRKKAKHLPSPNQRRANTTEKQDGTAKKPSGLHPEKIVLQEFRNLLDVAPPHVPVYEHVLEMGAKLDNASQKEALKCFSGLPLMSQLALLEVTKEKHEAEFIKEIVTSYCTMHEDQIDQNGMKAVEARYRFYAYVQRYAGHSEVGEKYQKVLRAITPPKN